MRQNMVFSTKKYEKLSGEGTQPPLQTLPPVGGDTSSPTSPPSSPIGACGTLTPPILKFWVRYWLELCRLRKQVRVY